MTLHVLNPFLKFSIILKPCILQMESLIMKVLFYLTCMLTVEHSSLFHAL